MLLVFGTNSRSVRKIPAITQIKRGKVIDKEMQDISGGQARTRLAFELRHPSGPKGIQNRIVFEKLPAGAPVLVFREGPCACKLPHSCINIGNETLSEQMPRSRKQF